MLLIAPAHSYRIPAYFAAATTLGVELVLASDGRHSLIPEVAGGVHIDFGDPGRSQKVLLDAARRRPVAAVVATDDAATELSSRVAATLGLPHNPPSAARIARRKDLAQIGRAHV